MKKKKRGSHLENNEKENILCKNLLKTGKEIVGVELIALKAFIIKMENKGLSSNFKKLE